MSDPVTTLSFNQLPVEVWLGILYYLDIPDIVRIRRVSRYLNGVSYRRDVWRDAYHKADFVRPPGPFLSQSTHDLETALVPCFRADRNLRRGGDSAQKERPTLKVRDIRYTGVALCANLILGRFLFIALKEEVRCYDLNLDAFDSNSGASIVHRSTGGTLKSFHCLSAIDVEGRPFACAVLSEAMQMDVPALNITQISIYLLNVTEPSEASLDLLRQFEYDRFDVEYVNLGPRVIVIQGEGGHDDFDDWHVIALDVHTCTQFLLPPVNRALEDVADLSGWIEEFTMPKSISTSTHLVFAMSFYKQTTGWSAAILAFALPPPTTRRHFTPIPLSPSHRGVVPGIDLRATVLLHDAILDPSTQDHLITLRVHAFEPSRPRSALVKYGTLRLGNTHISLDGVGTVALDLLGSFGRRFLMRFPSTQPSFDGIGRMFYTAERGIVGALEYDVRGHDRGHEAKVVEYPCVLRFSTPRIFLDYDPYSGRICFQSDMGKYSVIEILDFAV